MSARTLTTHRRPGFGRGHHAVQTPVGIEAVQISGSRVDLACCEQRSPGAEVADRRNQASVHPTRIERPYVWRDDELTPAIALDARYDQRNHDVQVRAVEMQRRDVFRPSHDVDPGPEIANSGVHLHPSCDRRDVAPPTRGSALAASRVVVPDVADRRQVGVQLQMLIVDQCRESRRNLDAGFDRTRWIEHWQPFSRSSIGSRRPESRKVHLRRSYFVAKAALIAASQARHAFTSEPLARDCW